MSEDFMIRPVEPAPTGIGLVAPFDFALDRELWRWLPAHVDLYTTRLPYLSDPVSVQLATALSDPRGVRNATRDVLAPEPSAVAYSCSSGSFVDGAAGEAAIVAAMLDAGAPAAVTTSGAMVAALTEIGAQRVALVTPYVDAVTDKLVDFLAAFGITATARFDLGLSGGIWKTSYTDVRNAVSTVDINGADALFIACTNVPTYDLVAPLEAQLEVPVLTANQVTMWAAMRDAGVIGVDAPGSLFADRGEDLTAA
ncbi:maleate isomerase [Prauserella isguenensis]|uniref:Maleate isomerase n=2 Tax=Prauserella isguenensis TaxID=1470180 RepID=A0A839RY67_9PSEU|nr:maleate isomerase [Prauserella isguenensis]